MQTQYKLEKLTDEHRDWFVNVACKQMLEQELKRSNLVNYDRLYELSYILEHCYVVLKEGIPVGATAAAIAPNLYNPQLYTVTEIFWYVMPEYRKTRAGYLLIKKLIDLSEEYNCDLIMSLLPTSNVDLSKFGFKLEEYAYRREI